MPVFSNSSLVDPLVPENRKNELVGAGRYNWSDGSSYEGGVMGGLRHGHGTFTSADGTLVRQSGMNAFYSYIQQICPLVPCSWHIQQKRDKTNHVAVAPSAHKTHADSSQNV